MYKIRNLSKRYPLKNGGEVEVLKEINLNIAKGKITAIVGPSGSGKSTLSKCLSLLEQPTSGELILDGTVLNQLSHSDLHQHRQKIGLIFQSSALLKRRTAAENIALPLEFLGVVDHQIEQRVNQLLESVGLADRAHHYPSQLSGGQQQRVGIARALALQPSIVIADEATSGLDPDATQAILKLLTQLRDELNLSVILITHEMDVVRQIADHVAVLEHGEIVEQGAVLDLILNYQSRIGAKILPLPVPSALPKHHTVFSATYSSAQNTPLNWLTELSLHLGYGLDIHASTIEVIAQATVGKVIFSLPHTLYQQQALQIQQHLDAWQIQASIISNPISHTSYAA